MRTRSKAMQKAAEHFQVGDLEAFYETLTVASFRNSRVCVSLANPSLPDVPLVGVSQGFEQMTGYSKAEILGRNCRFLSYGCPVPAEVRHQMRLATRTDRWFRGILVNRRKTGELFQNLLHMCWIKVGNSLYILGLQADVTKSDVNLSIAEHMQELDRLVDAIFASNVDAWAALQVADYNAARMPDFLPSPYVEKQLMPKYDIEMFREARSAFVLVAPGDEQAGTRVRYSNTFIEVESMDAPGPRSMHLRRVFSEPSFGSSEVDELPRLPAQVLRESACQFHGMALPPSTNRRKDAIEELEAKNEGELLSVGSTGHPHGCTPCSFYCYSLRGCDRGESCLFCHMNHPKRARKRGRKKSKRGDNYAWVCDEFDEDYAEEAIIGKSPPTCDSLTAQLLPVPTPASLLPLLDALEVLSPLPAAYAFYGCDTDFDFADGGTPRPSTSPPPTRLAPHSVLSSGEAPTMSQKLARTLSLRYNEESIVVARGQWKQVVPFMQGMDSPVTFSVTPTLPVGLTLRRNTGVISGIASEVTPLDGIVHMVTAECGEGSAQTFLRVLVLDPDVLRREAPDEYSGRGG